MVSQKLLPHKTNTVGKLRYKVASGYTVMYLFLDETVANGCFHDGVVRANNDLHVVGDEFPTGPISGIFVLCASLHAVVIYRPKSISDLDSGSLPRLYGEFMYAKLKIVVS